MKFAKKKKKMSGKSRTFMLITIPIVALFFTFNTLPLIQGAIYSFTNFRGYGSYEWVGFRNYIDLFHDARVGSSYLFTFKLAIVTTIIVNVVSLILAMALNSKIRFKSGLRGLYFLPNILGGLVVGYIFNYFFTYILPQIAIMLGFEGNSMLASSKTAWLAIAVVCAWQSIAMNTIIYISGLQINMVLCMKNFLMVFDQIMSLTKGGPAQSTESISYLIYNNGMSGGQFGFQSANAVVFFIVIVVISVLQMRFLGKKEEQL